jgi:hypothetical protein
VLFIPLVDVNQQYELHKMCILHTFMRYDIKQTYFAINVLRCTNFAMSESDILQCQGGSVKIHPAKHPIYSAEVETCVSSLYLQSHNIRLLCGRTVSTELPDPTLERQGSLLLYHLEGPKQLFLRCWELQGWGTVFRPARHRTPE